MLVRKSAEVSPVPYPGGIQKRVLVGPAQGAPTFVMRQFEVPPGSESPYHTHDWEHEVYILAGSGAAVSEGGETPVQPGDAVLVPPNELHCFRNTGPQTLTFLCLVPLRGEDSR